MQRAVVNIVVVVFCVSVDYVIPDGNQSLVNAYKKCRESADSKVCCDYLLHVCLTSWNDKVSQDMEVLVKENG